MSSAESQKSKLLVSHEYRSPPVGATELRHVSYEYYDRCLANTRPLQSPPNYRNQSKKKNSGRVSSQEENGERLSISAISRLIPSRGTKYRGRGPSSSDNLNSRTLTHHNRKMNEPDLEHFQSIPWCSELINNPKFTITPTFSRIPKPHAEDSLTASTLKSPAAISSCLSLYLIPPPSNPWISEVRSLMILGSGMNGGPNMLHGGIIATLMDDVIGTLLTVNKDQEGSPLTDNTVTVELNVKYLRPVRTPQTVLVVAKCREVLREGTRFLMDAEVRDEKGKVLAKADSVWTTIRRRPGQKL